MAASKQRVPSLTRRGAGTLAAALLAAGLAPALAAEELNLGTIGESPTKTIRRFTPLKDYLAKKGLPIGKIVGTETVEEMIGLLKEGKVDFVFESPYGALQMMEVAGAQPVLIREKDGVRSYNSVIFVDARSPVRGFDDLVGKVIAFQDPGSTSAYMLPKTLLQQRGYALAESAQPVPGKIAYYFAGTDANLIAHVQLGRAAAGGTDPVVVATLPRFRILQPQSPSVPRNVMVIRPGLDHAALKAALLGMAHDPDAAGVLNAIETPTGFSAFEGDPGRSMEEVKVSLGLGPSS